MLPSDLQLHGTVQDCSISSVLAMEISKYCTKLSSGNHWLTKKFLQKDLKKFIFSTVLVEGIPWAQWLLGYLQVQQWPYLEYFCHSLQKRNINSSQTYLNTTWPVVEMPRRHKMEKILHYWPFLKGIHWLLVNSPHKGQWWRALTFSLICAWTNSWANNRDAGDLRWHHTHYDVTVMHFCLFCR